MLPAATKRVGERGGSVSDAGMEKTKCRSAVHSAKGGKKDKEVMRAVYLNLIQGGEKNLTIHRVVAGPSMWGVTAAQFLAISC